jgi:patatin-like phospholipase/acyl hydrolase
VQCLAIDGGGVRGVLPAVILARLEHNLGAPLRRHFDLVAGTSTGALVAAAVAAEVPMVDLVAHWPELAREVFGERSMIELVRVLFRDGPSHPFYDADALASAIERIVPARELGKLAGAAMFVAYDVQRARPWVAKSWHPDHRELALTDVLLASCAAPGYFPGRVVAGRPLIDGGFAANNPALCALAEAVRVHGSFDRVRVLSLGTGAAPSPIAADDIVEWGLLEWAPRAISELLEGQVAAADYQAAQLLGSRYLRLQPEIPRHLRAMDRASSVPGLMLEARRFLAGGAEERLMEWIA